MKGNVLKELCERLFKHHNESADVCRGLEELDKSSGPQHRPKHMHNRDFYERMITADEGERIRNFPKIIKDALVLKGDERLLEKRKHALKVYKTLKEAGANFEFNPNEV